MEGITDMDQVCGSCGFTAGRHRGAAPHNCPQSETSRGEYTQQTFCKKEGMNCSGRYCNTYNFYAQPNQPDGTYKCYSCRNR